jgi:hypothetical protein
MSEEEKTVADSGESRSVRKRLVRVIDDLVKLVATLDPGWNSITTPDIVVEACVIVTNEAQEVARDFRRDEFEEIHSARKEAEVLREKLGIAISALRQCAIHDKTYMYTSDAVAAGVTTKLGAQMCTTPRRIADATLKYLGFGEAE